MGRAQRRRDRGDGDGGVLTARDLELCEMAYYEQLARRFHLQRNWELVLEYGLMLGTHDWASIPLPSPVLRNDSVCMVA